MKATNSLFIKSLMFLLIAVAGAQITYAQNTEVKEEQDKAAFVKSLIDSKNFMFKAQTVIPMRGRSRQLTSDYDVKLFNDSLISYLPYFGRSYSAPINPSEGGLQFTSTDYDYKTEAKKRGRWNITIKPKDVNDVRQLQLSVSENGYASLQVMSNNRDPISFNGIIVKREQE